jgi:anti-anti-sigma regulatory factor
VALTGELDIASADSAFGQVQNIIDRNHLPVVLDLAELTFCDAQARYPRRHQPGDRT